MPQSCHATGRNDLESGVIVSAPLEVSPLDTRVYRALTLSNKLNVLLISDEDSDKAAAALDVSVGSFSDPTELPGLAHFLEHMLFLGTEKYPQEGSYNEFLAENGGHTNAYTASENTNYHFDMLVSDRDPKQQCPRFKEALDRFSQFFTAPLFTESATDRELNAVHSEHQKNLQQDGRRLFQLKHSCANPEHPFSKFSTGSKETLYETPQQENIDTRANLLEFHKEYYSANLMNLSIIGPYPLDLLQDWVIELFSGIPNYNRNNPADEYRHLSPWLDEHVGLLYHAESVRDIRLLELSWCIDSYIDHNDSKPARLVSSVLGDEGEGSLLSLLKNNGWCDSLSAGPMEMNTFEIFVVSITLTSDGLDHIDDIIAMTYRYIRMVKAQGGIPKWLFDEEAGLSEIAFRFREREEPMPLVSRLASKMATLPSTEYLSGHFLFKKFDAEKSMEVINALTPQNGNVTIVGTFVMGTTDKTERWYKTPYRVERISEERVMKWIACEADDALHLPLENLFIPTEFELIGEPLKEGEEDTSGPSVVEENDHFELYHKLDRKFQRPRANIVLKMMTPLAYASPWHAVMADLLTSLLEDSLMEFSYPAEKAGFRYDLEKTDSGFVLVVSGYSHRIDVVLEAVVKKLTSFKADPTRFEMQKDIVERNYVNFGKGQPYQHAVYHLSYMLEEPRWHISEYVKCIRGGDITLDALNQYAADVLKRMWIKALVVGNVSEESAIGMVRMVKKTIGYSPLPKSELSSRRVVQVPIGRDVFYRATHTNEDDNNSAIVVFHQFGARGNPENDVRIELLSEILNKPAFHELRTKQQLGYMVFEGVIGHDGVQGIFVIVQSTVADPDELLKRIEGFLKTAKTELLGKMTNETFEDYVKALVARKSEPDRTIMKMATRVWDEIDKGFLRFDRRTEEVEALENVKKDEIVKLFDERIVVGGALRRRVISQIFGNQHPFEKRQTVSGEVVHHMVGALLFRRSHPLYAVVGNRGVRLQSAANGKEPMSVTE